MVSRSPETEYDVKFEKFVQYVVQEELRERRKLDFHWKPQYEICQPCHINYDFIGHYETIRHDADYVLRQITRYSNNTDVRFPATDVDSRNRNSREFLWNFYGNISAQNIRHLLKLYKKDYETFGYKIPDEIRQKLT